MAIETLFFIFPLKFSDPVVSRKNDSSLKEEAPSFHRALSNLRFRGPDYEVETFPHERIYFGQTVLSLTGEFNKPSGDYLISKSKRSIISFALSISSPVAG